IPDANYVSVTSDIEFYDALITKLAVQDAQNVLILIRDSGYLVNVTHDDDAKKLTEQEKFTTSPLREAGARKSIQDGW
ncbi:hypothetical protein, partial [Pseudomonas sp. BJa3]|uniref:hypothetical protein n=1 Tax=Pseudomonas sp. BJa3 TaxID=2986525 RepID=UPI002265BC29